MNLTKIWLPNNRTCFIVRWLNTISLPKLKALLTQFHYQALIKTDFHGSDKF